MLKRLHETGNIQSRPRTGRPRSACTPRNISVVRKRLKRTPRLSLRKVARDLKISSRSIRRIVQNRIKVRAYKRQRAHYLTDGMKATRLEKCRLLKKRAATCGHDNFLFSDEKIFTIEQIHNHQNDRVYAANLQSIDPNVKFVDHYQWWYGLGAGICSTGKTPLVFIEKGVKINQEVCQSKILENVLLPSSQTHFGNQRWIFQQDSAPSCTSIQWIFQYGLFFRANLLYEPHIIGNF